MIDRHAVSLVYIGSMNHRRVGDDYVGPGSPEEKSGTSLPSCGKAREDSHVTLEVKMKKHRKIIMRSEQRFRSQNSDESIR